MIEAEFQVNFSKGQLYSFHWTHAYSLFKLSVIRCVLDFDQVVGGMLLFRKTSQHFVFIFVAHFAFL